MSTDKNNSSDFTEPRFDRVERFPGGFAPNLSRFLNRKTRQSLLQSPPLDDRFSNPPGFPPRTPWYVPTHVRDRGDVCLADGPNLRCHEFVLRGNKHPRANCERLNLRLVREHLELAEGLHRFHWIEDVSLSRSYRD